MKSHRAEPKAPHGPGAGPLPARLRPPGSRPRPPEQAPQAPRRRARPGVFPSAPQSSSLASLALGGGLGGPRGAHGAADAPATLGARGGRTGRREVQASNHEGAASARQAAAPPPWELGRPEAGLRPDNAGGRARREAGAAEPGGGAPPPPPIHARAPLARAPSAPPGPAPLPPEPTSSRRGGARAPGRPLLTSPNFPQLQPSCALTVRHRGLPRGPSRGSAAPSPRRETMGGRSPDGRRAAEAAPAEARSEKGALGGDSPRLLGPRWLCAPPEPAAHALLGAPRGAGYPGWAGRPTGSQGLRAGIAEQGCPSSSTGPIGRPWAVRSGC